MNKILLSCVDFLYTIDPNAEVPIMLIDQHIGWDDEIGAGIMGDRFCRELLTLSDVYLKPKIDIWINSPGGVISDAQQIFAAILKSKAKVDTHNIGMAASSAGPIFLAGRNRYMMPHASFMLHPASGGDPKLRKVYEDSIVTMLTSRSLMDEEKTRALMARTTFLNAQECADLGMCTVEDLKEFNKPRKIPETASITDRWQEYRLVVNSVIDSKKTKITVMTKVTNRLKLNDSANEESIVEAIGQIENRAVSAEGKLVIQETEYKTKLDAVTNSMNTEKAAKEAAEAKLKAIEDADKTAKAEAVKNALKAEVAEGVKLGKIENKAESIKEMEDLAEKIGLDQFKAVMGKLPVSRTAPKTPVVTSIDPAKVGDIIGDSNSARAQKFAEYKNSVKNRLKS